MQEDCDCFVKKVRFDYDLTRGWEIYAEKTSWEAPKGERIEFHLEQKECRQNFCGVWLQYGQCVYCTLGEN